MKEPARFWQFGLKRSRPVEFDWWLGGVGNNFSVIAFFEIFATQGESVCAAIPETVIFRQVLCKQLTNEVVLSSGCGNILAQFRVKIDDRFAPGILKVVDVVSR